MQNLVIRLLDMSFSFLGLIILLPIMLIIFIFGLFDTGAPFFTQTRVGKHQKLFKLIKFRSMKIGTIQVGTHLANSDEITPLGKFLRRSKLDELPQLWNVLTGEMSIVGARPGLPSQRELREEREKRAVFNRKPGITGLAQINQVDMSTPRKLSRYDQLMCKNMNVYLYIKIIIETIKGKGRGDKVRGENN